VGGPGVKPGFAASDATVLFSYTTHPSGTRAGNPTRISSLGPKRHHALDHASTKWKGCRELNSDLKVRSLAPSIRWTTSPMCWKALPDSNRHSELRRLCPDPVE
jgi:hypothetical protein